MHRSARYNSGRMCHGEEVLIMALPAASRRTGARGVGATAAPGASPRNQQVSHQGKRARKLGAPHPFDVLPKNFKGHDLLWSIYQSSKR